MRRGGKASPGDNSAAISYTQSLSQLRFPQVFVSSACVLILVCWCSGHEWGWSYCRLAWNKDHVNNPTSTPIL